ncbi:MAG TPA: aromatic ring-hydroxylating dioxygenase subunit alpha [Stellaceae bacterium]|nr:aromatic ring-hydroxylating dioxygenase subunit alpha [Stellaceae bacterium]
MPDSGRNAIGDLAETCVWPEEGLTRIPDWVYTSREVYEREVERIFHGPCWSYVGLEAEVPNPGDFKRSFLGPTPVILTRDREGAVHVLANRCAHRGAELCRAARGNAKELVCPYHQWTYDLAGNLIGVPFRRGLKKEGGMPPGFRLEEHGLRRLKVARRGGVVFATFAAEIEPLEEYLGPEILVDFDAVFDGRELEILGYYRNIQPANWKLYHENLKDPYHATLLHAYLVTFGLLVAGNKSTMIVDASGRHGTMGSAKGDEVKVDDASRREMRAFHEQMKLHDGRILDYVREFRSPWSVTMQTIWPNLVVQRELNTLGTRHIVPHGPDEFTMIWTMFGYKGDTPEMTRHRLRQGNLMGPAGFLGLEDNEAMKFVQDGLEKSRAGAAVVELGGREEGSSRTLITEAAIRSMYRHWRQVMEL